MGLRSSLSVLAIGLLVLSSGCKLRDWRKTESRRPDVTQLGTLPPPQDMLRPVNAAMPAGPVIHASATLPVATPVAQQPRLLSPPSFSKLTAKLDRTAPASEMAVGWRNQIAYLPDPVQNGRMSPGVAGQMFLFGGPKLDFAQANGTLTVDLIDETPRPAGQPSAMAERWQFDKETLRRLQTKDETFGKSYVLFLPWPAYKPDITRVRISARYDPVDGYPIYATPSSITINAGSPFGSSPVWTEKTSTTSSTPPTNHVPSVGAASLPGIGGFTSAAPITQPGSILPPNAAGAPVAPPVMPLNPSEGLPPISINLPSR